MSDDLRADAAAFLTSVSARHRPDLGYTDLPPGLAAGARVCEHVLAECPADDGEPVTADWLAATGWELIGAQPDLRRWELVVCVDDHGDLGSTRHWLTVHEPQADADGREWWPIEFRQQHSTDDKADGVCLLSWVPLTTRGHVRRLLTALGVAR